MFSLGVYSGDELKDRILFTGSIEECIKELKNNLDQQIEEQKRFGQFLPRELEPDYREQYDPDPEPEIRRAPSPNRQRMKIPSPVKNEIIDSIAHTLSLFVWDDFLLVNGFEENHDFEDLRDTIPSFPSESMAVAKKLYEDTEKLSGKRIEDLFTDGYLYVPKEADPDAKNDYTTTAERLGEEIALTAHSGYPFLDLEYAFGLSIPPTDYTYTSLPKETLDDWQSIVNKIRGSV